MKRLFFTRGRKLKKNKKTLWCENIKTNLTLNKICLFPNKAPCFDSFQSLNPVSSILGQFEENWFSTDPDSLLDLYTSNLCSWSQTWTQTVLSSLIKVDLYAPVAPSAPSLRPDSSWLLRGKTHIHLPGTGALIS